MFSKLIPTDHRFFDMFAKTASLLHAGAAILAKIVEDPVHLKEHAAKLERLEHDADVVTHELLILLDKSFITPIDREDIHQLASSMDDCMDFMEAVSERMSLYEITEVTPQMRELVEVIGKQVDQIMQAIPLIKDFKYEKIMKHCVEINRLENLGDKISREAVAGLFKGGRDPLEVMKWRDIYDYLEIATDKCEDVAGIIEGIVLKHG